MTVSTFLKCPVLSGHCCIAMLRSEGQHDRHQTIGVNTVNTLLLLQNFVSGYYSVTGYKLGVI